VTYRRALTRSWNGRGIRLERQNDTFRVAAIPRRCMSGAFSKRRPGPLGEVPAFTGTAPDRGMEWHPSDPAPSQARRQTRDLIKPWQAEAKRSGSSSAEASAHAGNVRSSGPPTPACRMGWTSYPSPTPSDLRQTLSRLFGRDNHPTTTALPMVVSARPGTFVVDKLRAMFRRQDQAALSRERGERRTNTTPSQPPRPITG